MRDNDKKLLLEKISSFGNDATELMKDLIGINAIGPKNNGPGETEKANFLKSYLEKIGFQQVDNYPAPDPTVTSKERPNLVAVLPGLNPDKTLWIMSHMDVVPEGDLDKWNTDPFKAEVKDGKIYGRGSEDNNQGMVASILSAKAFLETGLQPEYNLGLVFVADEETGSEFGLSYLVDNHSGLFKKEDLIIIPDAGEPTGGMIEVAEKSIIWLKFKTFGKQVHASTPQLGVNAFRAASNLVVSLDRLHEIYNSRDEVFDPPISTFEPTKKEANVPNVNTLPGDDVFYLDCRILSEYDIEDVMKTIRKIADEVEVKYKVKIEISTEQKEQAAPATPVDAPIVQILKKSIKEIYNVDAEAKGIGGGTVAAIFRQNDFSVAVWSKLDDLAHQPNEYCQISNLIGDAKVFTLCATNQI